MSIKGDDHERVSNLKLIRPVVCPSINGQSLKPSNVHAILAYYPASSGLNLAGHTGTDLALVQKARQSLQQTLSLPRPIHWLDQVHSIDIVNLDQLHKKGMLIADGSFTQTPSLPCAVLSADCAPLLMCDLAGTQVAAIHGGWRGLAAGILDRAVALFQNPSQLLVSIGPCISQVHFEVGEDVRDAFGRRSNQFFLPSKQKANTWFGDLNGLIINELLSAGLAKNNIQTSSICTYASPDWPSYRLDQTPLRLASLIWRDEVKS